MNRCSTSYSRFFGSPPAASPRPGSGPPLVSAAAWVLSRNHLAFSASLAVVPPPFRLPDVERVLGRLSSRPASICFNASILSAFVCFVRNMLSSLVLLHRRSTAPVSLFFKPVEQATFQHKNVLNRRESTMPNQGNEFIFTRQIVAVLLCFLLCPLITRAQSIQPAPSSEEILEYVRGQLAFPKTAALAAGPIHASRFPGFYETTITAGAGAKTKTWNVALSNNRDFLIVGNLFEAGPDFQKTAVAEVKQTFDIPLDTEVSVGQAESGVYSAFYRVPVVVRTKTKQQSSDIFLTNDRQTLVIGLLFPIRARPRPEVLNSISFTDAVVQGPKDAPITIIEYGDLQCPACARMHEFMEKDLIPKYSGKLRIVFKEFPLVIHNWAWTGAIASKCVYEIDPKQFVEYRSSVFQRQLEITAADVKSSLLQIAKTVGIDVPKLSACIDDQTPKSLVDQDVREGKLLEISTTPTFVINGRIVAGMPEKDYFYKIIDDALAPRQAEDGLPAGPSCACDQTLGIPAKPVGSQKRQP